MILQNIRRVRHLCLVLGVSLVLTGCGQLFGPAPTPTPTPAPTPTLIPTPATTENSGGEAQAAATPQVTIPQGFSSVMDERLAYSFAVPRGWSELDLRSGQFQNLAGVFGLGDQLTTLNQFLESPAGQMLGKLYVTDLTAAMMGGLPSALVVTVADAPDYTAAEAQQLVQDLVERNAGALGDVNIGTIEATTINNLPAVRGTATVNLASVGLDKTAFGKVVGLLANDKIYVMLLLTQADQQANREPVFDQIIGTFRPE